MNRMLPLIISGLFITGLLAALAGRIVQMSRAEDPSTTHASTITTQPATVKTETATFAAGCFWGVEQTFRQVEGVVSTAVGYEGGKTDNPTYHDVCTDTTGHAETVDVQFDPTKVSYDKLLNIFWMNHDPTTVNRQGPDIGTQYRSVIFYHDAKQKETAEKSKAAWQAKFRRPIATEIVPATKFWRAEDYHQQYAEKNGVVCHIPVIPKD
jgi:peptide-methionine (S)-S-oxide reductase